VAFARARHLPLPPDLTGDAGDGLRILVVDDEVDFCEMIRDYLLMRGGFVVECANSGFSAGLTVARFRPHVILMDIMMPDMDGFDVLRQLRGAEETRLIPVIACTAYRDPVIERRIQTDGFDEFLEKPLRLHDLVMVVQRLGETRKVDFSEE